MHCVQVMVLKLVMGTNTHKKTWIAKTVIEMDIVVTGGYVLQEEMVYEWLNPVYLKPDVQEQIREKFEADSEIELRDFLKVNYNYGLQ